MNLGMPDVAPARRGLAPGWRDPRLWLGAAIVAASMVVGALVLGTSDGTVPVWVAADSFGAGHLLSADDLAVRRVHFDDATSAALYLGARRALPPDLRLSRGVGAGELLARSAVQPDSAHDLRQVPVSVPAGQVPAAVGVGDRVDVYLVPGTPGACRASTLCDGEPLVAGVTVLDLPSPADELAADGDRALVLAMTDAQARLFFQAVASAEDASITVVGRP